MDVWCRAPEDLTGSAELKPRGGLRLKWSLQHRVGGGGGL